MKMALGDDDRRKLAAIERELTTSDPRLARRLSGWTRVRLMATATTLVIVAAAGLILMVVGLNDSSLLVLGAGAVMTAGCVILAAWLLQASHRTGLDPGSHGAPDR